MSTRIVNRPRSKAAAPAPGPAPGPAPSLAPRTERGEQRRQALLEAAVAVFLEHGYEGASIEEVMRRVGGGSKASLYSYFGGKEGLFWEVISSRSDRFMQDLQIPEHADERLEQTLIDIARRFVRQVSAPEALELFRIIIAEATRFPDLAQRFYQQGAERIQRMMGRYLRLQHQAGRLHCPDPELAAMHFFELIRGPHLRQLLRLPPFPRGMSMDAYLRASIRLFLGGCAAAGRSNSRH